MAPPPRYIFYSALYLLILAFSGSLAAAASPSEDSVRAILEQHCYHCHGPDKQKGRVRLDTLSSDLVADRSAAETWHDALDSIQLGEMPPEDEPGLSSEERGTLVEWIEHRLELAHQAAAGEQPTGVVMRRLNRAEYQYTMTDLLGFDMDYADTLPPDPYSTDGFLNNGSALGISGMQMSAYLESARQAMDYVLVDGERPERETKVFDPNFRARGRLPSGEKRDRLGRNHYWAGSIEKMPRTGPFTLRITAKADRSEDMPIPSLQVEYGYFVAGLTVTFRDVLGEVIVDSDDFHTYEISGQAEFSPLPDQTVPAEKLNGVVVLSHALRDGIAPPKPKKVKRPGDPKSKDKKKRKPYTEQVYEEDPDFPQIVIDRVEFVQNDYPAWPPTHHQAIVGGRDLDAPGSIQAILSEFLQRAWRRPIDDDELAQWLGHYQQIRPTFDSSLAALREILALSLVSNHFLYLTEPQPEGEPTRPLSDHELVSRLSYFLWSSAPDAELMQVASDGSLDIEVQVDRLLADPRSQRFIEQFTTQWLDLEAVDRVAINPQYYDGFDNRLKALMAQESREYFDYILRSDVSAMELLSSDYTFANRHLASHYGLTGAGSMQFEKVSLAGSGRAGGLLGHAAMHMAGSDGAHTHPIKRAVWIRERLLHDPPKPPPPDVPTVEESVPDFAKLTVREQLEVHRQKESCADCHRGIDPWGIAMEEYDAIGLRRESIAKSKKPIDASTTLPGGSEVDGLLELQDYLLAERSDQFAHAMVAKLLTYALGRSLTFDDEPEVEAIVEDFAEADYRLVPLIHAITSSPIFTSR